ncbi:hypothetical protein PR048_021924 [Dryococelus australis]|uniref:Uncharacterized protein n=1 Tax=Dryococelus australis TaxID=614101 RepID=A0ABQ9GZJ8_9NEOP|nr:hypothetical protein PR048_021924 [Dryococelus australis]
MNRSVHLSLSISTFGRYVGLVGARKNEDYPYAKQLRRTAKMLLNLHAIQHRSQIDSSRTRVDYTLPPHSIANLFEMEPFPCGFMTLVFCSRPSPLVIGLHAVTASTSADGAHTNDNGSQARGRIKKKKKIRGFNGLRPRHFNPLLVGRLPFVHWLWPRFPGHVPTSRLSPSNRRGGVCRDFPCRSSGVLGDCTYRGPVACGEVLQGELVLSHYCTFSVHAAGAIFFFDIDIPSLTDRDRKGDDDVAGQLVVRLPTTRAARAVSRGNFDPARMRCVELRCVPPRKKSPPPPPLCLFGSEERSRGLRGRVRVGASGGRAMTPTTWTRDWSAAPLSRATHYFYLRPVGWRGSPKTHTRAFSPLHLFISAPAHNPESALSCSRSRDHINTTPARLPPRVQSPACSLQIFASGDRAGRCRWPVGFLGDLPFPPPFHSCAAPYSPHLTLIGSQHLDVKSRPNLFIHPQ